MKTMKIDGEKLRVAITEDMGISISEASKYIGYSQGYLGKIIQTGDAPERVVKLIESELGIGQKEFVQKDEREGENLSEVADVISKAVYDAIMRACESEEMNNAIYRGMRGALFEIEQKKAEKYFH